MGSLLSYVQMGLSVVIQVVYTPVMIRLLGQSEYGLYNTVASTISFLSILSLGFNSGYIRYYSIYKKEEKNDKIANLNGLFLVIFSIIGIIGLLCGLFLSNNLKIVFADGLTQDEYSTAKVLMLLLTINLAISFPMSVFQNIISAHERFVFLKILGMIKTVLSPLITLPLLIMGFRSIAMVSVTVSLALIVDCIYLFYVLKVLKQKFMFRDIEKGIFKSLFAYTVFIALNTIIDQINWNIDKLLLGRFRGTTEVAIYSVGFTLYHCYMLFSTSVSGVFTPRIHKIVNATKEDNAKQRKELTELFTKVGRIQFLILGLISTGIIFFGDYFIIHIWAGEGYGNAYYVSLLLILPASIALIQNLGIEVQRAENKHQVRSIIYAAMAIINLIASIFLCQLYGAIGSAIGTAFSLIVANGLIMNIYYHKRCNIDIIYFWKNMRKPVVALTLPIILGLLIDYFYEIDSITSFFICVVLYTVVYCVSMWLIGMNNYEKNLILKPIGKLLKR